MTNNADPDQLAMKKPADLDLHCLQKQGLSGFNRTRVNLLLFYKNKKGYCNFRCFLSYSIHLKINYGMTGSCVMQNVGKSCSDCLDMSYMSRQVLSFITKKY